MLSWAAAMALYPCGFSRASPVLMDDKLLWSSHKSAPKVLVYLLKILRALGTAVAVGAVGGWVWKKELL